MKLLCNISAAFAVVLGFFAVSATMTGQQASTPTSIVAGAGRPLANVLDQIQHQFLQPISYEEVPFENPTDLGSVAVKASATPNVSFSVTLGATDTTPYFATATTLNSYHNAGLPGVYSAIQNNGWVNVVPAQVLGTDGKMKPVVPIMSNKVTFAAISRDGADTLQLLADALSTTSGLKVLLLNQPFAFGEKVAVGANGEQAGDIIYKIGVSINRPVSYQCLYDVRSKTYYLNVAIVAPPNVPGSTIRPQPKPRPSVGPSNSPWFKKP
jgi:hypothetical protein